MVPAIDGPKRPYLAYLSRLYPNQSRDSLSALEPDLLGEALVIRVLEDARTPADFLRVVFEGADDDALRTGFTVLGRIATERADADRDWLAQVLAEDIQGRAEPAFQAAMAVGEYTAFSPLGQVLTEFLERAGTVELARRLERQLPKHTVGLRELNCWVVETLLKALPPADDEATDEATRAERARLLDNLGNRYSALGKPEEAMQATLKAVEIHRALAKDRPDAFLPDLARSLCHLGNRYSELAKPEEAMRATLKAVEHYRALDKARPDAFLPYLARSLNNLGVMYSRQKKPEEAIRATLEVVEHYRALDKARPDAFLPFLPYLAMSLSNLGAMWSEQGTFEEAMPAILEAVEHYRALAKARPDAFLPYLAGSLHNLGMALSKQEKPEEALKLARESLRIFTVLALRLPDLFATKLALCANNLTERLRALNMNIEQDPDLIQAQALLRDLAE